MSKIRGKDTKPEMLVRKFLHAQGFRYRLHDKKLTGKPDIVLRKHKTIIDVRGCFWHAHEGCKYGDHITTASKKISSRRRSAVERDRIKLVKWTELCWNVIVVWAECELEPRKKHSDIREKTLFHIKKALLKVENTSN